MAGPNPWDSDPVIGAAPAPASGLDITPLPKEAAVPSGYRFAPDGNTLEAIPGGPADPNKDAPKIGASPVSGPEYLKTLDTGTAGLVKALAEGRKSFPSGAALRAPYWQEMLTHVSNYDPGFDEVNYTGRAATRRDFTSGKAANNIRALNTAIGHLGHLEEQIPGTASHGGFPLATTVNAIENLARRSMGDAGPTNFDTTVSALAGELTAVYRGAGGAEADIQRYIQQLSPNASKDQKAGAIRNIVGLLKSRLDALNDQYRQGMGTTAQPLVLLDPQAQLIVQHLGGFDAAGSPQGPEAPQADGGPPLPSPGSPPPDVNPIANGEGGDGGPTLTPSDGETKTYIDEKQKALGEKIVGLMGKGADRNTILGFAVRADPKLRTDPVFRAWVDRAMAYRAKHPNAQFPIDPRFYTAEVPLSTEGVIPGTSLLSERDLDNAGQTAAGAALINAGNAATAGNLDKIVGDEPANRALAVAQGQHPTASLAGTLGGGAGAALGAEAALGGLGMAPGALRALLADSGYGAVANASSAPDGNLLGNLAKGALIGAGGSLAGRGIAKGVGAAASGVTSPTASYVARELPGGLTLGQAVSQSGRVGAAVKGIEDRLSGIPVVGDAVNARRTEGLQQMNSKAFDRALEPVGGKVSGKFGEQAVADAQDQVSQAFQKALGGKAATVDSPFITEAATAKRSIQSLPPSVAKDVENHVDTAIKDYFDPTSLTISGENMQGLLRDLQQVKSSYVGDPAGHRVGKAIDQITSSVENLFRRQTPDVMPQYDAAKQAFKRVSTLESAVLAAKNTSKDGNALFTPAQLGMADRANTVKFGGKHAAAAGKGDFHDFQRNMQEVLPSKVPDSGTAGRIAILAAPAALSGAGAGIGAASGDAQGGAETGLTLGTLLALAYSRTGQRALTAAVLKRSNAARAAGSAVRNAAPVIGHGTGAAVVLGGPRD